MKKIIIFIFILFAQMSFAKAELEIRFPLTESGYNRLIDLFNREYRNFDYELQTREDFYFDQFENHQYTLSKKEMPLKLRFQNDSFQIQKTTKTYIDGFLQFKETESNKKDIDLKVLAEIKKLYPLYFSNLMAKNPKALDINNAINEQIQKLALNKVISQLDNSIDAKKIFYPTQMNKKERVKIKLTKNNIDFEIVVGKTTTFDRITYELEAEPKADLPIEQIKKAFSLFVADAAITDKDIETNPAESFVVTSEKLLDQIL